MGHTVSRETKWGAGITSRQCGLVLGPRKSQIFVGLHVKGELYCPGIEGTTSLASCNLPRLWFHHVAVGCEEVFHRAIMLKGFWMKNFGSLSWTSCSSCVFLQPKPDFKTSFSKYSGLGYRFFHLMFFPPQMISHKEERKRGENSDWIILHHLQRGDLGLERTRKTMQMYWSHQNPFHGSEQLYFENSRCWYF